MPDDWLLDVLRDIEDYALLNNLDWLKPLINKVNVAAKAEMGRTGAVQTHGHDKVTQINTRKVRDVRSARRTLN